MNDYWNTPPEYDEPPDACDHASDIAYDAARERRN